MGSEDCDFDTLMSLLEKEDEEENRDDVGVDDEDTEILLKASQEIEEKASNISLTSSSHASTTSMSNVSDNEKLMAEMMKMQEKIQLLERQLKNQKNEEEKQETVKKSSVAKTPKPPPKSLSEAASSSSFLDALNTPASKLSAAKTKKKHKEQEKEIFGEVDDDDDDDWEGLDGERPAGLSDESKELKNLLKTKDGSRRVAHQPKSSAAIIPQTKSFFSSQNNKTSSTSSEKASSSYLASLIGIPNAAGITSSYTSDHVSTLKASKVDESNVVREQFSGIRIINPLVPADQMKLLMENRRIIKISSLRQKMGGTELNGDWVTIGVLVNKSEQKLSAKGQKYSIWKLSDLSDCDQAPISMFLFKDVNNDHWKTMVGSVMGFLNPSMLSNKDNDKQSKSYSSDTSFTVDNSKKILPLGMSRDLGTCKGKTKVGNPCTNFINTSQGEFCSYHVQSAYKKCSAKRAELQNGFSGVVPKFKKDMDKLRNSGNFTFKNEVFTTRPLQKATSKVSLQSLLDHQAKKDFSTRGYEDSLKKREEAENLRLRNLAGPGGKRSSDPSAAGRNELLGEKGEKEFNKEKNVDFHDLLSMQTPGAVQFVKYLKDQANSSETLARKNTPVTAKDFFKSKKEEEIMSMPKLGRGLDKNNFINLGQIPSTSSLSSKEVMARLAAEKKVKEMNGIARKDPNSTQVDSKSKEFQEKIKKRLREEEEANSPQPKTKKSKLLGNVDLNSPRIQKLIKAQSSHASLLTAEEEAKREQYFNILEKTETMEQKMINTMEIQVNAVTCTQCKYTALSASGLCLSENHKLLKVKAKKRFFRCTHCKHRCFSLDRIPTFPCSKCGGESFERTGMMAEKKGPKLPADELLLRGEEIKFLDSAR